MNAIFLILFVLSSLLILFRTPERFLPALLAGGQKAVTLSLSLLAVYCVWMGFMEVVKKCGLMQKLEKLLKPVIGALFTLPSDEAGEALAANLSANVLGLGGVATPFGIRAANLLSEREHAEKNHAMLLVLNATSLQLLPTTVITLRDSFGSAAAYDILLPSLIATLCSTLIGVLLVKVFVK